MNNDTVASFADDRSKVSKQQNTAVKMKRDFFLTACPGSGKTRTVGVRLAYWSTTIDPDLGRQRRIAALSYTNTAVKEILKSAATAGYHVTDPSYVGTFHSFLMRYVVRPFGREFMKCETQPRVVADTKRQKVASEILEYNNRGNYDVSIWDFEWRADDTLALKETPYALRAKVTAEKLAADLQDRAIRAKHALAKRGLLSPSDALYWAMKILQDNDIARTVALRFDELIVDEVQDLTDVQQACVRSLKKSDLHSLALVGDLDQAIYGFAYAKPKDIKSLIAATGITSLSLTENWRSSQAICDSTYKFSSGAEPDKAVGPNKHYGESPEIFLYRQGNEADLVDRFVDRLRKLGIPKTDSVVLCRQQSEIDSLAGSPLKLNRYLKPIVEAAQGLGKSQELESYTIAEIEKIVYFLAEPDQDIGTLTSDERLRLRLGVIDMLKSLPDLQVTCDKWAASARSGMINLLEQFTSEPPKIGHKLKAPNGSKHLMMQEMIGKSAHELNIQTIHSSKGESHEATLLYATESEDGLINNWDTWLLDNDYEETRIAYVALTRAEKYSAIALPDNCPSTVVRAYQDRGFVLNEYSYQPETQG